jgi:hypothetical protein
MRGWSIAQPTQIKKLFLNIIIEQGLHVLSSKKYRYQSQNFKQGNFVDLNLKILRESLREIKPDQKKYIMPVNQYGLAARIWKNKINNLETAILYLGILAIFNVKVFLLRTKVSVHSYRNRMIRLLQKQ